MTQLHCLLHFLFLFAILHLHVPFFIVYRSSQRVHCPVLHTLNARQGAAHLHFCLTVHSLLCNLH